MRGMLTGVPADDAYVERVLSLVEQIPSGRATTYGVLAATVGRGGPRGVGRVMAMYGAPVPWWRVVRADGSLPPSHQRDAVARYREESTPLKGSIADAATLRVDLAACLWEPPDAGDPLDPPGPPNDGDRDGPAGRSAAVRRGPRY